MVRPRLLGRRRGGVGGLTNEGEAGADADWGSALVARGREAVEMARTEGNVDAVLTARFFRFRAFFAGVEGL